MTKLIGLDPGKNKCGLLLADIFAGSVLQGKVVESNSVIRIISSWYENYTIEKIIIGNGTSGDYWQSKLKEKNFNSLHLVEERGTTFRARFRYWELWPPNPLMSWIPKNILFPPNNLDAVVAMILLEDYLNKKLTWSTKPSFKTWP